MSGIAGVIRFDKKPVQKSEIERMLTAIGHRGSASAVWLDGAVGLGTCSHSPSLSPSSCVADASIYGPDNVDAYSKYGEAISEKLDGDFAFALWDKNRQRLFMARDPFGVKPLFYAKYPDFLAFASEIKALLALPGVSAEINEDRVIRHLAAEGADISTTFYKNIFRLLHARHMSVGLDGQIDIKRYWSLDPGFETRLNSDEAYAEKFLQLFRAAVERRIPASGEVASTLSGGLDSSAVCAVTRRLMAERHDSRPLHAISLIFSEKNRSAYEEPYVRAMLSENELIRHLIPADDLSPLGTWEVMMRIEDEPIFQSTFFLIFQIYQKCRDTQITTLLDGMDGDMVAWHGQHHWFDLFRRADIAAIYKEYCFMGTLNIGAVNRIKQLYRLGLRPLVGAMRRKLLRDHSKAKLRPEYYPNDRARHAAAINDFRLFNSMETINRLSEYFKIDTRHPFFDKELVEYCVSLPDDQKMHGGFGRWTMRSALKNILPEKIRMRRGKTAPADVLNKALYNNDLSIIEDALLKKSSFIEKYANMGAVLKQFDQWKERPDDSNGLKLWNPVTTALWLSSR